MSLLANLPFTKPFFIPPNYAIPDNKLLQKSTINPQVPQPTDNKSLRCIQFAGDRSGCGHWRMWWPEQLLNIYGKADVTGGTYMIFDPRYYQGVGKVRIQRQATPQQLEFVQYLKQVQKQINQEFEIVYEIDDIIFSEDIPDYNKFKFAFTDPKIRETCCNIMRECNEITVTCDFMKEYYREKTGINEVTVIPNFVPRFWMDRFYDPARISQNFEYNKRKPRILYPGSGAHFDVDNRTGYKDDFHHVVDVIRKTVNDYQWVFIGALPLPLRDLLQEKKIEMHPWVNLMDYPKKIFDLNVNLIYAPLQNNTFNKAKSDLKYIEACCYGIPCVCQDIETYSNARLKFNTGDELIDQIKRLLSDRKLYMSESKQARKVAEGRWMEDNIDYYVELYKYSYGDPNRKLINKLNKVKK